MIDIGPQDITRLCINLCCGATYCYSCHHLRSKRTKCFLPLGKTYPISFYDGYACGINDVGSAYNPHLDPIWLIDLRNLFYDMWDDESVHHVNFQSGGGEFMS